MPGNNCLLIQSGRREDVSGRVSERSFEDNNDKCRSRWTRREEREGEEGALVSPASWLQVSEESGCHVHL